LAGNGTRIEEFLAVATPQQAALAGAACCERASGILFWVVSSSGRADELETYRAALDFIWTDPAAGVPGSPVPAAAIEHMHELVIGDEATGAAAFAFYSAIAIHAMLKFREAPGLPLVKECLMTGRSQASFLGRRTDSDVLAEEEASLEHDIGRILQGPDPELPAELRARARRVARERLEVAIRPG
jgi:hypothetical protein